MTIYLQQHTSYIQAFENKYFELIQIHRENSKDVWTHETSGKSAFVLMLNEYRKIIEVLRRMDNETWLRDKDIAHTPISDTALFGIAYSIFYYGVGENSSRELRASLERINISDTEAIIKYLADDKKALRTLNRSYFDGHQSHLGHYYRHLFQTVKYVDSQNLTEKEKYSYVKILRAQLSTHEQALLFINSIFNIGSKWKDEGYIEKYCLIKNIPEEFFDSGKEINPKNIYPNIIFEFEEGNS